MATHRASKRARNRGPAGAARGTARAPFRIVPGASLSDRREPEGERRGSSSPRPPSRLKKKRRGGGGGGAGGAEISVDREEDIDDDGDVPRIFAPPSPPTAGKIRRYDGTTGKFGPWSELLCPRRRRRGDEDQRIRDLDGDRDDDDDGNGHGPMPAGGRERLVLNLSRGGRLRFIPGALIGNRREEIAGAMSVCRLYRQYGIGLHPEPRVHVLLSSFADDDDRDKADADDAGAGAGGSKDPRSIVPKPKPGYFYHGVSMKALPLSLVPEIEALAANLAESYRLPEKNWSIGVDLVVYRDGNDSISWHSDDTQGETLILSLVIESWGGAARPVRVRPKRDKFGRLRDGDEEIELLVGEGDAYDMDGGCPQRLLKGRRAGAGAGAHGHYF